MASILRYNMVQLAQNVKYLTGQVLAHTGGEVFGVTKVLSGDVRVAELYMKNGCSGIAESRWQNLKKIAESDFYRSELARGKRIPLMNLRIPALSEIDKIVAYSDMTLLSEYVTAKALDEQAGRQGKKYGVILMIDLGDLREGYIPENAQSLSESEWMNVIREPVKAILELRNITLTGIGTNLACYGGVAPSETNMGMLVSLRATLEKEFSISLPVISGANSSGIPFMLEGKMPREVTNFRLGESLLLGVNVLNRQPLNGMHQEAFILASEIIELKNKPSVPIGEQGQNAFGETVCFENIGTRKRAILSIGRQDVLVDGLRPIDPNVVILGASSDHLEIDVTDSSKKYGLGDFIEFVPSYGALLALSTSMYVDKQYV